MPITKPNQEEIVEWLITITRVLCHLSYDTRLHSFYQRFVFPIDEQERLENEAMGIYKVLTAFPDHGDRPEYEKRLVEIDDELERLYDE